MKIIFVRHAEPDYSIDSLTEKGFKEATLLSERMAKITPSSVYCSVLGRAKDTAKPSLEKWGIDAEYCDWLREFSYAKVGYDRGGETHSCWDFLPEYWTNIEGIYDKSKWKNVDFIASSTVPEAYDTVCSEFDKILQKNGYTRKGDIYETEKGNHNTLVFFAHFGVISMIISHIMNVSPFVISHSTVLLPSSVTEFATEERIEGKVSLRCLYMGDISHLYSANEPASFAARFAECFDDDTRH